MTPEQIKARCEQHLHVFQAQIDMRGWSDDLCVEILESLYREAMAKGLEMAAEDAKRRTIHAESNAEGQNEELFKLWLEVGQGHRLQERWCCDQATTLKETPQ